MTIQVFTHPGNRRGANSTRPHERDREAPMREARQAAPDWARASAALSFSESSRFSRGTEPLRREMSYLVVMSYTAISIAGDTVSRIRVRQQHCFRASQPTWRCPSLLFCQSHAATDSRDENLKAKLPAAAVESKEERKRERLGEPTRSILDAPDDALQSASLSSRCLDDQPNGPDFSISDWKIRESLIVDW
jgi:hypothetical protein